MLTLDDLPERWLTGSYKSTISGGVNGNLFDYIEYNSFRVAVFKDFARGVAGYGLYGYGNGNFDDWTLLSDPVDSLEEAIHVMVTCAILGAFDAYI